MAPTTARLAELLGALSRVTDLGAGVPPEAALRTTVLAAHLGRALRLGPEALRDVYYTALLRYLGCSGYAHETAWVGGGDDLAFLRAFEAVDPTDLGGVAATALRDLARDAPLAARARAIARLLADPRAPKKLAEAHCAQATALAAAIGARRGVVAALGEIYERFDGRGQPAGRRGRELSEPARVLHVALAAEIHLRRGGPAEAVKVVRAGRGRAFDPDIAEAFLETAPVAIARVTGASSWEAFLEAEPAPFAELPPGRVGDVALAFARYVDLKSPFTLGHSVGVARVAEAAARAAGLGDGDAEALRIAALLHDLGRAAIPNGVWDKPGALGAMERERVQEHAQHGERVLARGGPLAPYAALVGQHHERLDGGGYHRGLGAQGISFPARLLAACDVWHALGEERAHRPAHARDAAIRALRDEAARGRLDAKAVAAVLDAVDAKPARVRASWPAGLSDREVEVLRLVAMGKSNREIGAALFISPRTAKVHVEHIYAKIGASTRAAAALFAATHDLVEAAPAKR
jgi:putative nucleotidyltransferase with HDIG domain